VEVAAAMERSVEKEFEMKRLVYDSPSVVEIQALVPIFASIHPCKPILYLLIYCANDFVRQR
jgi:hypothetical protein